MYAMQDHVRQVPVGNYWSRGTQKPRNLWHYQTFDEDSRQRRLDVCCSELSCVQILEAVLVNCSSVFKSSIRLISSKLTLKKKRYFISVLHIFFTNALLYKISKLCVKWCQCYSHFTNLAVSSVVGQSLMLCCLWHVSRKWSLSNIDLRH